jgi:NADH:ubiquinone oxidoreductase subunit K
MVMFPLFVIASEAKQSILSCCGEVDCFASLAMTVKCVEMSLGCGLALVLFREHFARDVPVHAFSS